MELLLTAIATALLGYQSIAPEFRNNSLYAFNVDPQDRSIIVMNTQTGEMFRCNQDFKCSNGLDLNQPIKKASTD